MRKYALDLTTEDTIIAKDGRYVIVEDVYMSDDDRFVIIIGYFEDNGDDFDRQVDPDSTYKVRA